ncbi:MAG: zinc-binding alcohol dehydrogenase family protein [Planctomycetaceae bacterium]
MKALQLTAPRSWKQIDIAPPGPPAAGQVLVRVHRVGVCGTDVGCYLGKFPYFEFPRIPGHELGVEVVAIGENVSHLQPGQRCCVEPYLNCGACDACVRGFNNCCEHNQTFGVMCDGGLTEEVVLPGRKLHPVGDLSYAQAALVETLAIGCHAVDRGAPRASESVLIIGAGPIGLSALEFARLTGANVIVADISDSRLAFVRERMNVENIVQFQGDEADMTAVRNVNGGRLADVVIDATGNNHSMARAMEFAVFAGRVVFVGITQGQLAFAHAPVFHRRELTLMGSRNARSSDFPRIVKLIAEGGVDTRPWITHTGPFEDVPDLFPRWIDPSNGVIKAMIEVTTD